MTSVDRGITRSKTESGEFVEDGDFTFADLVGFLRRNWGFLGLLTLVLSAVAVTVVLVLPKQYQKEVALTTALAPSELLARVGGDGSQPLPSEEEINNSAVSLLKGGPFGEVEVTPTYDAPTQQINVVLRSRDEGSLAEVTPNMVSFLEAELGEKYAGELEDTLEMQFTRTERDVEIGHDTVNWAEQQYEQAYGSTTESAMEGVVSGAYLILGQAEAKLENLEQTREELPRLTADTISVEVVTESDVQQSRTNAALVVLAVAASFAAAVALALAREALARRK